ncbi:MAG: disulfide bond formation protein B [Candidatus Accumulibacter sp.]|jgi:disulfide bond formation protein DsbB|nr:disulfide bond formation protein B [Accumulibacter sp.]
MDAGNGRYSPTTRGLYKPSFPGAFHAHTAFGIASLARRPFRPYFLTLFALCAGELCFGVFYLQEVKGLAPCPRCIMQRCAPLAAGLIALPPPSTTAVRASTAPFVTLAALAGSGIAARQSRREKSPEAPSPKEIFRFGHALDISLIMIIVYMEWLFHYHSFLAAVCGWRYSRHSRPALSRALFPSRWPLP